MLYFLGAVTFFIVNEYKYIIYFLVLGSGGANHLSNAGSGGPSPAGGAADNVSVSNPFDDVSPSPPPRGGPFPGGPHPPYPSGTPPRPQGYSGQGGYNQYSSPGPGGPPDQYSTYPASSGYPPAVRPVYPPYASESGAPPPPPPNANSAPGPPVAGQDHYNRYNLVSAPTSTYPQRPNYTGPPASAGPPSSQPPTGPYNSQQEYYRPEQVCKKLYKSRQFLKNYKIVFYSKILHLLPIILEDQLKIKICHRLQDHKHRGGIQILLRINRHINMVNRGHRFMVCAFMQFII